MTALTPGSVKKTKILFWVSTGLLALFTLPGIFFINSQMSIDGMRHLGLPDWFRWELGIGKVIGALILIIPMIGKRLKEWAYVAMGIDYTSALIAFLSIDGPVPMSFAPLISFALLITSYVSFHKLNDRQL